MPPLFSVWHLLFLSPQLLSFPLPLRVWPLTHRQCRWPCLDFQWKVLKLEHCQLKYKKSKWNPHMCNINSSNCKKLKSKITTNFKNWKKEFYIHFNSFLYCWYYQLSCNLNRTLFTFAIRSIRSWREVCVGGMPGHTWGFLRNINFYYDNFFFVL